MQSLSLLRRLAAPSLVSRMTVGRAAACCLPKKEGGEVLLTDEPTSNFSSLRKHFTPSPKSPKPSSPKHKGFGSVSKASECADGAIIMDS